MHKGFGLSGALTNSVMRDLGDLPEGFPVLAGSIGPSHGFVHVLDFDQPVEVFGLNLKPGRSHSRRPTWRRSHPARRHSRPPYGYRKASGDRETSARTGTRPRVQFRDFRKGMGGLRGGTHLNASSGCTEEQARSITGHKITQMINKYATGARCLKGTGYTL